MSEGKYSKFLTILLIVVIIAIISLLGFLGYDFYRKYYIEKQNEEVLNQFENQIKNQVNNTTNTITNEINTDPVENIVNPYDNTSNGGNSSSGSNGKYPQMGGYNVMGKIEIPKTNVKCAILEKVTRKSIELAVGIQAGPGLNKPGNTVISGHNYRNGLFFSNNGKLENGDKIYITDENGNRVAYTIYKKYITSPNDAQYMTRNTEGRTEISLSTCTDDTQGRIIIWARAD